MKVADTAAEPGTADRTIRNAAALEAPRTALRRPRAALNKTPGRVFSESHTAVRTKWGRGRGGPARTAQTLSWPRWTQVVPQSFKHCGLRGSVMQAALGHRGPR